MSGLYKKLTDYGHSDAYPMHMPGHKRNTALYEMENPYGFDITEIDDFDDLHEAEGILRESMDLAAELFGVDESWYLINGSTAGILSGIHGCVRPGDRILVARNCHKAVYHAIVLNQLEPSYLYPPVDPKTGIFASVEPVDVETALCAAESEGRPFSLVVLTSPTYEGIISDIQMIGDICHRHGVPLMVDEAHGAHLSSGQLYTSCFPAGAVACGADLVVQSLHKTLAAFTQTGILHAQGSLVDRRRVKHALDIYQTSSPSYVLMAGIDCCIRLLRSPEGKRQMGEWARLLREFYRRTEDLKVLQLVTLDTCERFFAWDPSKLVVSTVGTGHSGRELMQILRERYHLEMEMASRDYIIAMTGQGESEEGLARFAQAILEIDEAWYQEMCPSGEDTSLESSGGVVGKNRDSCAVDTFPSVRIQEKRRMLPWEAEGVSGEGTELGAESLGRISLEFVYAYPPGIPILVPGEEVTEEVLEVIASYEAVDIRMRGYEDQENRRLRTV